MRIYSWGVIILQPYFRGVSSAGRNGAAASVVCVLSQFRPISGHFLRTSVFTVFSLFLFILSCFELFFTLFLLTQANVHDAKNPAVTKDVLWRTRPMLDQIKKVNQKIWNLSHKVSIDEQTVGFQGRGYGAVRITYKNEGDGFQVLHVQNYSITCTQVEHSHKLNTRPIFGLFSCILPHDLNMTGHCGPYTTIRVDQPALDFAH